LSPANRHAGKARQRESERLYRTLFELSPDGILLEDLKGNILDANQALCRSFGYSREELLGESVRCLVPPEDRAEVEAHLASLQAGQTLEHEVWNLRKNGERCLMRLTETPLWLPDGRRGILVVARDITQSQRAEMTKEVFLSLGAQLSAARSPVEAAREIYAAADQLWQWDAAALDLYSPESNRIESVLDCDIMEGQRRELPVTLPAGPPSPRMLRVMRQGAELISRVSPKIASTDWVGFGNVPRATATKMYVPIRRGGQAVGVLSIQSYKPDAYGQEDLRTLQALADYCAGALERIRTSQALQQREELNRSIVATALDGFYVIDFAAHPGGAIVEVNDAYCRLTGYSREELLQRRIGDLEAKETPEQMAQHKARILATGSDRFETLHRRKDGQEIAVEVSVSRLAGSHTRVFGFVRDITQRKRAELLKEAFLSLGAKLSTARNPADAARAIYASADLLWHWDCGVLDLQLAETGQMETALAYDVVEGQRREVKPPDRISRASSKLRRVMTQGAELSLRQPGDPPGTDTVRFGDISRPSASLMSVPVRRESRTVGVLSVQSYTPNAFTQEDLQTLQVLADYCGGAVERLESEAALRQSEERYRSLVNNLNVGVYRNTPGPHGCFIQVNPALVRMYGYDSVEEFLQSRVSDHYQNPADRARFVAEVLRRGTVVNHELRLKRKDGTPIWGSLNATAHRGPDGQVDWIDGVLEDITERKRAEFLLQAQRDLGVNLSLTTSLEAAYKCLLDVALQLRGVDCGGVYLLAGASGGMDLVAHRGISSAFVQSVSHLGAEDPRMRRVRLGRPLLQSRSTTPRLRGGLYQREGIRASAIIPLAHEHHIIGALVLASHLDDELPARTKVVSEAIAAQAAGAIARIRAEAEQHRLERQILEISDREQARIGQDIHDGLCQQLVSLAFDANSLGRHLSGQEHPEAGVALRLADLLDQAITESRQLSRGLFPIRLEGEGLAPALEELAKTTRDRFRVRCRLITQEPVRIENGTVATHLYRIAQEAITNAVKHSQAKVISMSLRARAGQLELKVEDNGTGFAPGAATTAAGMGLHIMDYRARSIGGTLRVTPRSRRGTLVSCCVAGPPA
jgi:PAS domain S-box-containing protein